MLRMPAFLTHLLSVVLTALLLCTPCAAQDPPAPSEPWLAIASPMDGEWVSTRRPTLWIFFDPGDAPLDRASLRVWLDAGTSAERDVTYLAVDEPDAVTIELPEALALTEGAHTAAAEIRDVQGRLAAATAAFAVDSLAPVFQVVATDVLRNPQGTIRVPFEDAAPGLLPGSFRAVLDPETPQSRDVSGLAIAAPGEMRLSFAGSAALGQGFH
ncbi:MAG: hypothetical protein HZA54_17675, partial [Planctomycetes bacterium]|nr:hypothetical protein [Planctomycetota bacterium]